MKMDTGGTRRGKIKIAEKVDSKYDKKEMKGKKNKDEYGREK